MKSLDTPRQYEIATKSEHKTQFFINKKATKKKSEIVG